MSHISTHNLQLKKLIKDMALLVEEHELDVLKYKFFATQDGVVISQEICKFYQRSVNSQS